MKKRIVAIEYCNDGDILANDIVNEHGATIVTKNTVLNSYIIDRMLLWDVKSVHIYDTEDSVDKKVDALNQKYNLNVKEVKELLCSIAEGQKINEEKLNSVSESILKDINETQNIISLLDKVKTTDEYTYTHCMNVAIYSMLIGKWLKLPLSKIKKLVTAGLLHDVGKTKVPLEILNKPGKLLTEEFEIMKQHSLYGCNILKDIGLLDRDVFTAVLQHHEREDGSGYPLKLKSNEISMFSKIIAVSDVYDAVTSDRIYKKRATPFEAFKIFRSECTNSFDYKIVNVFLSNLAAFYTGSKVLLNSGSIGEVAFVPPHDICKPIIKVENSFYDLSKEKGIEITSLVNA